MKKIEVSVFPFEVHIRYISVIITKTEINFSGEKISVLMKIPSSYTDTKKLMDYLAGYRLMSHYVRLIPATPFPVMIKGVLYVGKEYKEELKKFLATSFWEDCLSIGDFGASFTEEKVQGLLLKFPHSLIIRDFYVGRSTNSWDYFCFPCFLDFKEESSPISLLEIRTLEEFREAEPSERRIYVPDVVEPLENTFIPKQEIEGPSEQQE